MDTGKLKKFAQAARRDLIQQVGGRLALVLAEDSAARREQPRAVSELEKEIKAHGREAVIERAAYTWFNRLTALRFMDAKGYNRIMTVSPGEGQSQPEILAEAKQGHIDEQSVPQKVREQVFALLDGRAPSRDPQAEAYRLLLVAVCNYWHQAMPYLFERISDWTELLMPDDLLSDTAVRTRIRSVLSAEDCQDVEVIGWLYQFYISEKKDEVFAGLKKGKKITAENIPAATQLFTPHWIVRYLVENSLGRLWLLNRPNSRLAERMDYYIAPEEPETDFLKITKPEEIKLCDPACGSGHMLTYAFDLLYAIYEEEGYAPDDIPALILEHNLTGIEIDERAGALAAFALAMKAAEKLGRRKFLKLAVQPNIVVLRDVRLSEQELEDYMAEVGRDLFTADLRETLGQLSQAKNFGSLIQPALKDPSEIRRVLKTKDFEGNLFLSGTHRQVLSAIQMTEVLSPKYHVVVANPPYMGNKGMSPQLGDWAKAHYPASRRDLYSMFIERSLSLARSNGLASLLTIQNWMFLSSFEDLREKILVSHGVRSLIQIGYNSFPELNSKVAQAAAFVIEKSGRGITTQYFNLNDSPQSSDKEEVFLNKLSQGSFFQVDQRDFTSIPGAPIAYWISPSLRSIFKTAKKLADVARPRQGLASGDNDRFMRFWHEVGLEKTGFSQSDYREAIDSGFKWFPHNKGGAYRKWFGNNDFVLAFDSKNFLALSQMGNHLPSRRLYFKSGMSWTALTSGKFNGRYTENSIFDAKGPVLFADDGHDIGFFMAFCNSVVATEILKILAPTLDFNQGPVGNLPIVELPQKATSFEISKISRECIALAADDWNGSEFSWGFTALPLLTAKNQAETLHSAYGRLRAQWQKMTDELQQLEEENNRIFIEAYGLQDELTPEVPIEEITLTCNPAYRYGIRFSEEEREKRLLADTMAEFLSYAVGCMFGRYSLNKPGLVLANQGETLADYLAQVPAPSFMPDEDNVIPILDADWFTDDITERFREFLRLTFGPEHFQENLEFIEQALGKPVRKYFLKDFYKDHVQRYKKRPIYWLFSSPKGSFNALIYMHRYRPDTVSVILNEYLREFVTKLGARIQQLEQIEASASTSARDKTAALKEIKQLRDTLAELEDWERKVLLPLATERIAIDLDDGVKANYPKFGPALAKIPGLSA